MRAHWVPRPRPPARAGQRAPPSRPSSRCRQTHRVGRRLCASAGPCCPATPRTRPSRSSRARSSLARLGCGSRRSGAVASPPACHPAGPPSTLWQQPDAGYGGAFARPCGDCARASPLPRSSGTTFIIGLQGNAAGAFWSRDAATRTDRSGRRASGAATASLRQAASVPAEHAAEPGRARSAGPSTSALRGE